MITFLKMLGLIFAGLYLTVAFISFDLFWVTQAHYFDRIWIAVISAILAALVASIGAE